MVAHWHFNSFLLRKSIDGFLITYTQPAAHRCNSLRQALYIYSKIISPLVDLFAIPFIVAPTLTTMIECCVLEGSISAQFNRISLLFNCSLVVQLERDMPAPRCSEKIREEELYHIFL